MRVTFRRLTRTFMGDGDSLRVSADGAEVGTVQQSRDGRSWFWYALRNTASNPVATCDEAKAQCKAWLLAQQEVG